MKGNYREVARKTWGAIINPAVLCLFLPVLQGQGSVDFVNFTGFWGQFAIACAISLPLSLAFPLGRVTGACCRSLGIVEGSLAFRLFSMLFAATFLFALIALAEVIFLTGIGTVEGATLFARWVELFVPYWPFVALAGFVTEPLCDALSLPFESRKHETEEGLLGIDA